MAHCSVLEAHQTPTDKPTRRIKRSGGQSLVRQGLAIWLKENVLLKLLAVNSVRRNGSLRESPRVFIPDKLPSHKAPGTKANGPVVEKNSNLIAVVRLANQMARQSAL